jgi:hypothetical protein
VIFNSKQLEEIENINDSSGIFEDADDEAAGDEVGEAAMEWRRQLSARTLPRVRSAPARAASTSSSGFLPGFRVGRRAAGSRAG